MIWGEPMTRLATAPLDSDRSATVPEDGPVWKSACKRDPHRHAGQSAPTTWISRRCLYRILDAATSLTTPACGVTFIFIKHHHSLVQGPVST